MAVPETNMSINGHEQVEGSGSLEGLTGRQKAAALLITLGSDACAQIFQMLGEQEVERLAAEIAGMPYIGANALSGILREFRAMVSAEAGALQGDVAFATEAMSKALGAKGSDAVERVRSSSKTFDLLTATPSSTELLLGMIREEHPQTIALILVHIKEQRAADILAGLPQALRVDVTSRIANMTTVSSEVVAHIEDALQMKSYGQQRIRAGGVRAAAEILNRIDTEVEKDIMQSMGSTDPELAEAISDLMFTYEDIISIADAGIQKLLPELPEDDLLMSLKASTEAIKNKFLRNMSERRRQIIQEDLDTMPLVRLKDVLLAQKRVLTIIKEMSQDGKLEMVRDEEEVYV